MQSPSGYQCRSGKVDPKIHMGLQGNSIANQTGAQGHPCWEWDRLFSSGRTTAPVWPTRQGSVRMRSSLWLPQVDMSSLGAGPAQHCPSLSPWALMPPSGQILLHRVIKVRSSRVQLFKKFCAESLHSAQEKTNENTVNPWITQELGVPTPTPHLAPHNQKSAYRLEAHAWLGLPRKALRRCCGTSGLETGAWALAQQWLEWLLRVPWRGREQSRWPCEQNGRCWGRQEDLYSKMCSVPHSGKGGKHKTGPNLWSPFGQKTEQGPGFSYSNANRNKGTIWGEETLMEYLENAEKYILGTKMIFAGLNRRVREIFFSIWNGQHLHEMLLQLKNIY